MFISIRPENPADLRAIEALIARAFLHAEHTSHTEQFIVNALRKADQLSISQAAVDEHGTIQGHVAVSPVTLSDGSKDWYGLGPISVEPSAQLQGIGTALMTAAIAALKEMDAAGCVLLGDPHYYQRFGFKAESALTLADVPPEYFQALPMKGQIPIAEVFYHDSFNAIA